MGYRPRGKGAAVLKLVSTLGSDRAFDPETIQILVDAFDEAWKSFKQPAPLLLQNDTSKLHVKH